MEAWMKHGCRKWFSSFYSRKYWKVWAGSKAIVHSPSLLPVCCVHPYFWKLMTWHCWIMFFLHKIWCGTSRVQDTLPVLDLPDQAAPPACSSHICFLRTPRATFGLIYKARDSYFETQLQHIHSFCSKLPLSQTAPIPIPFSIPACVWVVFEARRGCPQIAVSVHVTSVSRLIDCCIYNYQAMR